MSVFSGERADNTYRHRYRLPDLLRERFAHLVRTLETVGSRYEKTDPIRNNNASNPNKNSETSEALYELGQVVAELGGWAIDHQMGKAVCGIGWIPRELGPGVKDDTVALWAEATEIASSHKMEQIGAAIRGFDDVPPPLRPASHQSQPPELQRLMLINVLSSLNNGLQLDILSDLIAGLSELNVGGVPELLEPVKKGHGYQRAKYWLLAAEYVAYWQAYDNAPTKGVYKRHVVEAFGLVDAGDIDGALDDRIRTVNNYAKQAAERLGPIRVEQRIAMARSFGEGARRVDNGQAPQIKSIDLFGRYSRDELVKAGQRYQALKRQ